MPVTRFDLAWSACQLPCSRYCLRDREHVVEENLPPFSEAYSQGRLINEDDDYFADELEDLLDFSLALTSTKTSIFFLQLMTA